MQETIDEILDKYSISVLNNLNKENIYKIIAFLEKNDCVCIDDIIEDYLDIFTIEYDTFVDKFEQLNKKYNNKYLNMVSENMSLLEELF